ncbi:MAG: hypothetical protein QHH02_03975 [Syntrophomonadaceae bacterium]|nr:hypothetical protein [Syntrophomonadaceae bacterium]
MLKGWLLVFGLTILTFYSIYFFWILRGQPERFEQMLLQGIARQRGSGESEFSPPMLVALVVGVSLLLEAGYFVLALTVIEIIAYQVLTFFFILFEVWHGFKAVPVIRAMLHPEEFSEELFDWRLERLSTQFYVLHVLITIGLLLIT